AKELTEHFKDHDGAIEAIGLAIKSFESLLSRDAKHAEARRYLSTAYGVRAEAQLRRDNYEDAIRDFSAALKIAPVRLKVAYAASRAFCRAKLGRHAESWAEIDQIGSKAIQLGDGAVLVNLALTCQHCAHAATSDTSLTMEQRATLVERYSVGAIRFLSHCTSPDDVAYIQESADLREILARPDCPSHLRRPPQTKPGI
ncbi:MAG TPA: tetratricopeptide repeat protein, partial [Pirellulaceae bacterium]|nr:tetratricopeptide repeat protein [Pirellulaceae bacterium]